jgi:hypothetical protein
MHVSLLALRVEGVAIGLIKDNVEAVAAAQVFQSPFMMPSLLWTPVGPTQLQLSCRPPATR